MTDRARRPQGIRTTNSCFCETPQPRLTPARGLQGDGPKADNDVKFADRQKLFPWRPKYWQAGNQVMGIAAAVFGAIMLYHCFLTTDPQGVVPSAMAGFALGAYKQYQIMPVTTEDRAKKMKQGWRHIIRYAPPRSDLLTHEATC